MHNFQVSNDETDPKIRIYVKNRVGQTLFENFDFLVKVKGPLGQSFFFFFSGSLDRVTDSGRVKGTGSSFGAEFFGFCKSRTAGLSGDSTLVK